MTDLFAEKAADWDTRPVPQQISAGVFTAIQRRVALSPALTVMDFGAGTGLVCGKLAPLVGRILAVDISPAMLEQLRARPELGDRVDVICQDLVEQPLDRQVDLVVSAMAMHHVQDTRALLRALFAHLVPGGRVALADLDREDGSFHPPNTEGVYHLGFDRDALAELLVDAGFEEVEIETACEVEREGSRYPIFLATATKPR